MYEDLSGSVLNSSLVWSASFLFKSNYTLMRSHSLYEKRGRSIITTRVISIYGGKLDLDHDVQKMFLIGSNGQLDLKDRIYGLHSQHEVGGLKVL